nr:reverse transcriptase domain-containing protein [Tanacetum cinerariifolium]
KGRNRRRSKQRIENSNLEEHSHPVVTMVNQRTMAELLRAPTEGTTNLRNEISNFQQRFDEFFHKAWDRYKDLLRACPHHGFTELHQLDTFYNALNPANQDSLNATAEIAKLTHTVNQQTSAVTTAMTAMLKQFQAAPPPAPVKAVEEICVTCGTAVNYNQGNLGYLPPWSGSLPSNTVANPKGELKGITTRSGLVIDGPTVPTPSQSINSEVDERVEETFTDPNLAEYTIKVPPTPIQKYKPPSQREFVVHQRDPHHPNIPYPSRMLKQKQQEKDEVQIHKFWQMFKQLHINITLADALILMPKYQKMLKALLSNKEKLQELANTPPNENFSAIILKKLPKKLRDPRKFLILCGFSELKCKALADLGASINLMPLSVWKKLCLPELIPTRMTLELANRTICTPAGIARDIFVLTARALIDVYGDEMILHDGDERLTLIMRLDTSSYSNQPQKESINLINVFNNLSEDSLEDLFPNQQSGNPTFSPHPELTSSEVNNDIFDSEGCNVLSEKLLDLDSTKDLHPPFHDNPLNKDSSLKDSIDQKDLANLADIFVDPILETFTDEHAFDYSSPSIFDEYDDDLKVESYAGNVYDDDPFDSKGEKIKESKLLIDELDIPCDFLPPSEYDSFISQDSSRVDTLPLTNNEDKIFNPGTLIREKPVEIITRVVQDKNLAISNAFLVLGILILLSVNLFSSKKLPSQRCYSLFHLKMRKKFSNQGYTLLKKFILILSQNYLIKAIMFSKSTRFLKA